MAQLTPVGDDNEHVHDSFLNELLKLEKLYAHELLGAKNERRSKVLELINKTVAKIPQARETSEN